MFSFFTTSEVKQSALQEQILFIVEQALLYESRHIVTSDRWRKFGQLHHELLIKYEFHRGQQQLLRSFHEAEARRVYARMQRIIQLFDCYKLVKAQSLCNLEERLRMQHALLQEIYGQFVARREQQYSIDTDIAFFAAIYDEVMPIIANINDCYR